MPVDQFNVRLGSSLARRVRMKAAGDGCHPRDVIAEALVGHYGWPADEPEPLDGQLTVDEEPRNGELTAKEPGHKPPVGLASPSASRRPRAGRKAGRPGKGEAPGDGAASAGNGRAAEPGSNASPEPLPDGPPAASDPGGSEPPAGCPECGGELHLFADYPTADGDIDILRCEDCDYTRPADEQEQA